MEKRLWTIRETAFLLGVSEDTVRRHVNAGNLHSIRIGKRVQVDGESLRRVVRSGLNPPEPFRELVQNCTGALVSE